MGIGAGVFLAAIGAILTFAVNKTVNGIDIATVGVILMIAGAIGVALDLAIWAPRRRTGVVVDRAPAAVTAPAQDVEVTRTTRSY